MLNTEGAFDYKTVFYGMSPQEIREANLALNIKIEADKQAAKKH